MRVAEGKHALIPYIFLQYGGAWLINQNTTV